MPVVGQATGASGSCAADSYNGRRDARRVAGHRLQGSLEHIMDVERYRARLLNLEKDLVNRRERAIGNAQGQLADSPRDSADAAVADHEESTDLAEAERDNTLLIQVRDALRRITDGTFGLCVVDSRPIEENRLEASPWTPYCLEHATALERSENRRMPTS
jgi:RNA polymerase-binding transcription factor DksA